MWEHRTATATSASTTVLDDNDATKRDYYEMAGKKQSDTGASLSESADPILRNHYRSKQPTYQEGGFETGTRAISSDEPSPVFAHNMEEP